MKKLALIGVVMTVCGFAFAQTNIGDACAKPGDFSQTGDDVLLCGSQGWGKFSTVGETFFRITYSLSEDGKAIGSGSMSARDGKPVYQWDRHITTYASDAKKDQSGKIVITQADLETGRFLTFAPVLTTDGRIKMYVSVNDSLLKSLDPVSVGDLTIQTPVVRRVGSTQTLVMDQDKEMVIQLPSAANDGSAKYTLKLKATAI